MWTLAVLLNARLLDYYFQRLSVPFRGEFKSANKQFIAPLPIREPDSVGTERLDSLGQRLHDSASAISSERSGFLGWLGQQLGADPASLPGSTVLTRYELHTLNAVVAVLERSSGALRVEPGSRAFRERLASELESSLDRLTPLEAELKSSIADADDLVYDLYELPAALRAVVDREYDG